MRTSKKREPRGTVQITQPVTVKRLQALLKNRESARLDVTVNELALLGDEKTITKSLLYLADNSRLVRIKNPRITVTANSHAVRVLREILASAKQSSCRKRNLTRLIGSLYGVPVGRPPKKVSADIFQRVIALHQEKRSIRSISKALGGISRNAVAKIILLHAEREQALEKES